MKLVVLALSVLALSVLALSVLASCATPNVSRSAGNAIRNTSYVLPGGDRVLRHETVVNAPRKEIWRLLSTNEGLRSFAAPVIAIDLKPGGLWESAYQLDRKIGDERNIQNEILSYLPDEMLSLRIHRTPPGFPHPDVAKSVWTVVRLEDGGMNKTRVEISMLPWKAGAEWDVVYSFFERGNAITLERLRQRVETGPVDWNAMTRPR